jgi:hypothetical protein
MATATPTARRTAYAADANTAPPTTTRTEKGVSLARGPALILGTILTAGGLYFLYKAHGFPRFSNFPNGNARIDGKHFFGIFGINGWTGMLTAVAGALLLFGAAQHLLAKTMSLIVGVALGAAAVIAAVSGNVLGLAAANRLTELGWAVCALILLFNTLIPRRRRTVVVADGAAAGTAPVRQPVATRGTEAPVVTRGTDEHVVSRGHGEPVATRGTDEPVVTRADEQPTGVSRADEQPTAVAPRAEQPATATQPLHDEQATAVRTPYDEQPTAARPVTETAQPAATEDE